MQPFRESFATQQLLPPYQSVGVTTHAFLFRLSTGVVQAYCDRYLNLGEPWGRPYHYVALEKSPLGILSISDYPSVTTLDPTHKGYGLAHAGWDNVPQKELFAAAPVIRYSVAAGGVLVDPVLQWVQPFLVNDNSSAAFAGREILGLETLYGPIEIKTKDGGGLDICTSLPSWKVFRRDSPQQLLPFLNVETGPPLTDPELDAIASDAANRPETIADILALEAAIPNVYKIAHGLLPATMTMVILKQFREAGNPSKAIYQALVTGDCRFLNVREVKVYARAACNVEFTCGAMVNEIIGTLLDVPVAGLNATQRNSASGDETRQLEVEAAFSFTADIKFDAIKTLHEFPIV